MADTSFAQKPARAAGNTVQFPLRPGEEEAQESAQRKFWIQLNGGSDEQDWQKEEQVARETGVTPEFSHANRDDSQWQMLRQDEAAAAGPISTSTTPAQRSADEASTRSEGRRDEQLAKQQDKPHAENVELQSPNSDLGPESRSVDGPVQLHRSDLQAVDPSPYQLTPEMMKEIEEDEIGRVVLNGADLTDRQLNAIRMRMKTYNRSAASNIAAHDVLHLLGRRMSGASREDIARDYLKAKKAYAERRQRVQENDILIDLGQGAINFTRSIPYALSSAVINPEIGRAYRQMTQKPGPELNNLLRDISALQLGDSSAKIRIEAGIKDHGGEYAPILRSLARRKLSEQLTPDAIIEEFNALSIEMHRASVAEAVEYINGLTAVRDWSKPDDEVWESAGGRIAKAAAEGAVSAVLVAAASYTGPAAPLVAATALAALGANKAAYEAAAASMKAGDPIDVQIEKARAAALEGATIEVLSVIPVGKFAGKVVGSLGGSTLVSRTSNAVGNDMRDMALNTAKNIALGKPPAEELMEGFIGNKLFELSKAGLKRATPSRHDLAAWQESQIDRFRRDNYFQFEAQRISETTFEIKRPSIGAKTEADWNMTKGQMQHRNDLTRGKR